MNSLSQIAATASKSRSFDAYVADSAVINEGKPDLSLSLRQLDNLVCFSKYAALKSAGAAQTSKDQSKGSPCDSSGACSHDFLFLARNGFKFTCLARIVLFYLRLSFCSFSGGGTAFGTSNSLAAKCNFCSSSLKLLIRIACVLRSKRAKSRSGFSSS